MQASKIISKTLANNLIRYACIVAMIVLTPLFAKPMASLFDWAVLKWSKAGDLREFWEDFLVAFFCILEWVGYLLVKKFLMKKLYTKETVLVEIENRENAAIEEAAIAEVNTK